MTPAITRSLAEAIWKEIQALRWQRLSVIRGEREKPLEVCQACGWYEHSPYGGMKCDPKAAAVVAKLRVEVGEHVPCSQLGYGGHNFVFETDEHFHVRFQVGEGGKGKAPFQLRDVWLLGDLDQEAAADLVRTLVLWRARHPKKGRR